LTSHHLPSTVHTYQCLRAQPLINRPTECFSPRQPRPCPHPVTLTRLIIVTPWYSSAASSQHALYRLAQTHAPFSFLWATAVRVTGWSELGGSHRTFNQQLGRPSEENAVVEVKHRLQRPVRTLSAAPTWHQHVHHTRASCPQSDSLARTPTRERGELRRVGSSCASAAVQRPPQRVPMSPCTLPPHAGEPAVHVRQAFAEMDGLSDGQGWARWVRCSGGAAQAWRSPQRRVCQPPCPPARRTSLTCPRSSSRSFACRYLPTCVSVSYMYREPKP
jgi:hypothetical protein